MAKTSLIALVLAVSLAACTAEEPADPLPDDSTDVVALVRFVVAAGPTDEPYDDFLSKRVEFFRNVPGLKRKYYTDGGEPGLSIGVYHWDSREQALDYYDDAWHADMEARMESYSLEIVDVEIIQDNEADEVTRF